MNEQKLLPLSECGFEIYQEKDRVYFINRHTWPWAIAAWILGGLSFIFAINATVWIGLAWSRRGQEYVAATIFIILAILTTSVFGMAYKKYARRKMIPRSQVTDTLIADLSTGVLRAKGAGTITPFSKLRLSVHLDIFDSTKGFMRVVKIYWPKGSVRIFKTGNLKKAKALVEELAKLGIGSKQV